MADRYEIRYGKFGAYFHDTRMNRCEQGGDMSLQCVAGVMNAADARIAELETALNLAAGELSTYRDTDKHPQEQRDRLLAEAAALQQKETTA